MSVPAARRLSAALEPFVGSVYFSPECHAGYAALGFAGSSGSTPDGVELPDGPAYFTSRGSVMGHVPGEVVASAFAVFNPAAVVPAVAYGWTLTDAPTIEAARTDGAVAQLARILGDEPDRVGWVRDTLLRACGPLRPEGRPLYAGVLSQGLPGSPLADCWRLGDRLREFRGDAHTAAWTSAGFDATEIGLLTELFIGLPMGSYIRTRAWSSDDLAAAQERLRSRGLLEGDGFSAAGREAREAVEATTDAAMAPALAAVGDDLDDLVATLAGWSRAVQAGGGYLRSGADDLAR